MVIQTSDSRIVTTVRRLAKQYQWRLLSETTWANSALAIDSNPADDECAHRACLTVYSEVLYKACQDVENRQQREQAYRELYDYLWRYACHKNPALANDAAQLAIELVFRSFHDPTLVKCREPKAFLQFAQFKLIDAVGRIKNQQKQDKDLIYFSPDQADEPKDPVAQVLDPGLTPEEQVVREETVAERTKWLTEVIERVALQTLGCLQILWSNSRLHQQLKAVILTFVDRCKDHDIALDLQTERKNIHVLRSRGLDKLRTCLSRHFLTEIRS